MEEQNHQEFDFNQWRSIKECGATYCAFGLAASLPEFNAEGLHFEDSKSRKIVLDGFKEPFNADYHDINKLIAARFFDICEIEVNFLFMTDAVLKISTTGREVARLIRYFVEHETVEGFKSVFGCRIYTLI